MATVNANLLKHNLMMAIDDRGKISCHKVNLCFIYLQPSECIVSGTFNKKNYQKDILTLSPCKLSK